MDLNTIDWKHMTNMSCILLASLSFLAVIALPLMAIGGQTLSLIRQRTSYAKCAKQLTVLALILGWTITFASAWPIWQTIGPVFMGFLSSANANGLETSWPAVWAAGKQALNANMYLQAHVYVGALIFGATLCMTAFFALWKQWKAHRIAVQCLPLIATCWYALAALGTVSILSANSAFVQGIPYAQSLQNFFVPSVDYSYWNAAPYVLPLAFAMAGGIACLWLLIRRHRDDFGRDYYAQMLPWCASWARNGWLVFWLFLLASTGMQWIDLVQQENYLSSPAFMYSIAYLLLWLIPGILWTLTMRSAHPLRHKATLILAFIFGMMSIVPIYLSI